jgi:hypothetical protein
LKTVSVPDGGLAGRPPGARFFAWFTAGLLLFLISLFVEKQQTENRGQEKEENILWPSAVER